MMQEVPPELRENTSAHVRAHLAPPSPQQCIENHAARVKKSLQERIAAFDYKVLRPHFPHLRHDVDFFDALREKLHAIREANGIANLREDYDAAQLKRDLKLYAALPIESVPADMQALTKLFSDYKEMASEPDLHNGNNEWRADMVAAIRGEPVKESLAFDLGRCPT